MDLRSKEVTEGFERAPARAMLRAVGFGDGDFGKPIIGIANAHSTITPCNAGLDVLAHRAEAAVRQAGGAIVGGPGAPRLARIGAYRLPGIPAVSLLIRLDMAGFAISAGSACSSGSLHASPVLTAMGYADAAAAEVIRVSFGATTTEAEIAAFAQALAAIVADMRGRAA